MKKRVKPILTALGFLLFAGFISVLVLKQLGRKVTSTFSTARCVFTESEPNLLKYLQDPEYRIIEKGIDDRGTIWVRFEREQLEGSVIQYAEKDDPSYKEIVNYVGDLKPWQPKQFKPFSSLKNPHGSPAPTP